MSSNENQIGKYIICDGLGIGEIINITNLESKGDFYRVSFPTSKAVNYFATGENKGYRFIESTANIESAIDDFKKKHKSHSFDTTQDKISYFKKNLKCANVTNMAKNLSILNSENEIHVSLRKIFKDSLESFIDEIIFVLSVSRAEACKMLGIKKI